MGHEPSFYHLFRQGAYAAGQEGGDSSKQNRQELFVVAALGFVLSHDPKFMEFFIRDICECPKIAKRPKRVEVVCQDGHCSDLALMAGSHRIVVEAKVKAELDDHQKPWEAAFNKDGRPSGYGYQIRHKVRAKSATYVIVQNGYEEKILGCSQGRPPIRCISKTWADLLRFASHRRSPLVSDFYKSLGQFPIPSMKEKDYVHLRKAQNAKDAAEMFVLLQAVADKFKIPRRRRKWDTDINDEGAFVGIELPKGLANFKLIQQRVGRNQKLLGWFGYESPTGEAPRISLWLYSEQRNLENLEAYLRKLGLRGSQEKRGGISFRKANPGQTDYVWLTGLLSRLQSGAKGL